MSFSIDDLQKTITADELVDSWIGQLETLGVPASKWRKAGVYRTILRVVAIMYAGFTVVFVAFIRSGFLDLATGGALTLLARYVFGVERVDASNATGTLTLTNAGGAATPSFAAGTVTTTASGGRAYVNAEPFLIAAGASLPVAFVAVTPGSDGSAAPGEIDTLETVIVGVTVTNPTAFVGTDEQSDADLRAVCRAKLGALSNFGPRSAYFYAVTTALRGDGTRVDINRVWVSPASSTGIVTVYAASPSGVPTSGDLSLAAANIERLARPDSVTANLLAVTPKPLSTSLTVWAIARDGLTEDAIRTAVLAALEQWTATYPIGGIKKPPSTSGYVYASGIEGVAKGADPAIFAVDGVGGDLLLLPGEVATLTATVAVRLVQTDNAS